MFAVQEGGEEEEEGVKGRREKEGGGWGYVVLWCGFVFLEIFNGRSRLIVRGL